MATRLQRYMTRANFSGQRSVASQVVFFGNSSARPFVFEVLSCWQSQGPALLIRVQGYCRHKVLKSYDHKNIANACARRLGRPASPRPKGQEIQKALGGTGQAHTVFKGGGPRKGCALSVHGAPMTKPVHATFSLSANTLLRYEVPCKPNTASLPLGGVSSPDAPANRVPEKGFMGRVSGGVSFLTFLGTDAERRDPHGIGLREGASLKSVCGGGLGRKETGSWSACSTGRV